jgi:hypothetical protein
VSVPAEVSLQAVQAELSLLLAYADSAGLAVDVTTLAEDNLRFFIRFQNANHEPFYIEFDCREYPLHPPTVEFVNENRSERGLKQLYPQGFHGTPCICMRYNRKAYSERGGPHADWRLLDWRLPTGNGIAIDGLALMVSDLDSKIRDSSGRMS